MSMHCSWQLLKTGNTHRWLEPLLEGATSSAAAMQLVITLQQAGCAGFHYQTVAKVAVLPVTMAATDHAERLCIELLV